MSIAFIIYVTVITQNSYIYTLVVLTYLEK